MTYAERSFMGPDTHTSRCQRPADRPRDRLQGYLNDQLDGPNKVKRLAAIADCTPKTAANILAGHWPSDLHFSAIVRQFGRDLLNAVFEPDIDATLARLRAEEAKLDQAFQAARSHRLQVEGCPDGHPQRLEATDAVAPQERSGVVTAISRSRRRTLR